MPLSTQGNATQLRMPWGMQPVGPAAVVSEGKRTQLRKIMKMIGQNTHPVTIF